MDLFSGNISLLSKALDYSSLKQKVTAQNIANADVPNYKSKGVSFNSMLQEASQQQLKAYRTDPRHMPFASQKGEPSIYVKNSTRFQHNGNNVDIDKEMSDLATNQIYYNALIERMNGKFSTLQSVLRGGN